MYKILPYSFNQAEKIGVKIIESDKPKYKIKVYYKDKIIYIGDTNYSDYPHYILSHGLSYANKRRILYKKRHEKDRNVIGTAGYFSDKILW